MSHKRRAMAAIGPMMLSLLGAGCAPDGGAGEGQQAIIGGQDDPGDPSVVMLWVTKSGQPGGVLCSGEVVSPHVVLTAGHCVSAMLSMADGWVFKIFLGDDFNDPLQRAVAANFVPVTEVHANPKFNEKFLMNGNDVGIAITGPPVGPPPLPINRWPLTEAQVGQPVRFVGYGINDVTDAGEQSAGTKRQTMSKLVQYDANSITFVDPNHGTCRGDSGGPAFMKLGGAEVIVGVTSYGPFDCTSGTDTRVDAYTDFIDQYIKQADPTYVLPDMGPPPQYDLAHAVDMASPPPPSSGGGCAVAARPSGAWPFVLLVGGAIVARARRRRRA